MRFPTVKLVERAVYKVLYKGKKYTFEKGIDYPDIHPDFAVHLLQLVDNRKNKLFSADYGVTIASATCEHSGFATEEADKIKTKPGKRAKANKSGGPPKKTREAYKLSIKKEKKKKKKK